jgi:hypothetical protein
MKDLSILIPIYIKPLDKIRRCINSALDQQLNLEIIIVYQWFSEESWNYIQELEKQYDFIKVFFYKYPLSHHIARISHIKDCNGKYTAFLDSDDYVDKDYYKDCFDTLEKENADATPGNLKVYLDNNLSKTTEYKDITKEDAMFDDYWLRGIFNTEKIKIVVSLLNLAKYFLTNHEDVFEKILFFHICDKIVLIQSNKYYHFDQISKKLNNNLLFNSVYSIIIIYHFIINFIEQNYKHCIQRFKRRIFNIFEINKTLKTKYFNNLFKNFTFNTIPKIVHNNNFNFNFYRLNWYDNIISLPTSDGNKYYNKLFLQFYILYSYGGVFCLDDYYFKSIDELLQKDIMIFKQVSTFNLDIIGACIKHPVIERVFFYLLDEERRKESIEYYKENIMKLLDIDLLPEEDFDKYFQPVNLFLGKKC